MSSCVPRTFLYPGPDLKQPRTGELSMGSRRHDHRQRRDARHRIRVAGVRRGGDRQASGSAGKDRGRLCRRRRDADPHALSVGRPQRLRHRLLRPRPACRCAWPGRACCAIPTCRLRRIGAEIEPGADFAALRRGDLVFWNGHVAIMTDPDTMIHASGHTMTVAHEPLRQAIDRIGYLYGGPTGFRRPVKALSAGANIPLPCRRRSAAARRARTRPSARASA